MAAYGVHRHPRPRGIFVDGVLSTRSSLPVIPGYTYGVKVAVSIPDALFRRAERLARRRKMSRSQLYAVALERLVDFDDDGQITRRLDAVHGTLDSDLDAGLLAAQAEAVRERW